MVVRTSTAVFTGTTDTAGSWDAGTVTLTDDDGAGQTTGVNAEKLSDDVDVTVETMDSTTYAGTTCTAWRDEEGGTELLGTEIFASNAVANMGTDYSTGHGTWVPAAKSEKVIYLVHWTLGTDTANDAQGDGVDVTFTWEAQSATA